MIRKSSLRDEDEFSFCRCAFQQFVSVARVSERDALGDDRVNLARSWIVLLHHPQNLGPAEVIDDDTLHYPSVIRDDGVGGLHPLPRRSS